MAWLAAAPVVLVVLLFVTAPYGRHTRAGWGPALSARAGWVLMESPAVVVPAAFFLLGGGGATAVAFVALWELHYLNRTVVYPLRLPREARPMPLSIAGTGFGFNVINGTLIGAGLFHFGVVREAAWLLDARFVGGAAVFLLGFFINNRADAIMRKLRAPGETGYKIPSGGLYRWVSCPNYLGEILEWGGFALATWSLPGLAFFVWTIANLAPRARSHHRWYRAKFADYPPERKALVPLIW